MILINGNFLCRNLTGIERFAFETCRQLDLLLSEKKESGLNVSILIPPNARIFPDFTNIHPIVSKTALKSFPKWDMITVKKEAERNKAIPLNFSNTAPLGKNCGISFLHDIYAKDFPEDFVTLKDRLIRIYSCFHYRNIAKNALCILTVSEFSKHQILNAYPTDESKIHVLPNGWEHFNTVQEDPSIFDRVPQLSEKKFFFTLGSLQKRKNLRWILDYASKNPEQIFAISGKPIGGMQSGELSDLKKLSNIVFLGYVSDGEVKALMKNCAAFVFPSYYEGFGIPPLEALSTGAKIIVSDSASLPEIYGEAAAYINPYNTDCSLLELSEKTVSKEAVEKVLKKYTYRNAAERLYEILVQYGEE
ncbi:MAG: glycosyltransferase family 4 protein [Treponema sp.]|uniref:glycosyltransferase family 4 protein n=1 Tax=Treponema sp. TaxID=166 RepID=UPI0025D5A183|nr:glycosyltransferase family 1 protein [Treponema sp.]MBQ9281254.1 glycosyltransferase family 4 protein [Treponema sp.]